MSATRARYFFLTAVLVAADQITKRLLASSLELHDSREIVAGLLNLTHVRNRGAAFGFLSNADLPYQAILFSALSLAALSADNEKIVSDLLNVLYRTKEAICGPVPTGPSDKAPSPNGCLLNAQRSLAERLREARNVANEVLNEVSPTSSSGSVR